jgi:protein-disulfide isomerase
MEEMQPVRLDVFCDYECPFCKKMHQVLKKLQTEFGPELMQIYWHHFPLPPEMHPNAFPAALAAEAAREQGGSPAFVEMSNRIFGLRSGPNEQRLMKIAREMGLDKARFMRDVRSGRLADRIRRSQQSGMRSGVEGTPTLFINRRLYGGGSAIGALRRTLRSEMEP